MKAADNHRFNAGDIVYAKKEPETALTIRRYVDRIYYCKKNGDTDHKELVYFDRELMDSPSLRN